MNIELSVIIPVYNAAATLELCLQSLTAALDSTTELIVVDDGPNDESIAIIRRYPCKFIQLLNNRGAAHARNIGAQHSRGKILFFTDADCLIEKSTLLRVKHHMSLLGDNIVLGGSYTAQPYDKCFYSRFQSLFIRYSENKHPFSPDYIATHAMAIRKKTFIQSGGFASITGPILEDVEFSHRLRRAGVQLKMLPGLQVQHIFNYSLSDSWRNAIRKTRYWVQYSLHNQDLLADSGTASVELKTNVCSFYLILLLTALTGMGLSYAWTAVLPVVGINLTTNSELLKLFYAQKGRHQAGVYTMLYYLLVYPLPVGIGLFAGLLGFLNQTWARKQV